MKPVFWPVFWFCAVASALADSIPTSTVRPLLDEVVAALPDEPLTITGTLTVRKRRGVVLQRLGFEMSVDWGGDPPVARYLVRDAFGAEMERLTVWYREGGASSYEYARGSPPAEAPRPELSARIQDSDMSWADLTLSFLWWSEGQIVGTEEIRGRECHVVDVMAPAGSDAPYARCRLWIDRDIRLLMQAEGFGPDGAPVRRLWIKSFKKIDDRWMIKDMEVESQPPVRRTKLTIHDATARTRP